MAYFEGTLEEFYSFLGPRTSDLVYKIAKSYRKEQKSCKDTNENGKICGKWKSLDAAHLKGRERKILIKEIIEEFGVKNTNQDIYKITLDEFEKQFSKKHENFFEVIQFRCRKHHKQYDIANKIEDIKDNVIVDINTITPPDIEINFSTDSEIIKKYIINQIQYLTNDNCRIAKVSTKNWNFNLLVKELKQDFYLICYNQTDFSIIILKIKKETLEIESKKSNKNKVSLNIPYSEDIFFEKKTKYEFDVVEKFQLTL